MGAAGTGENSGSGTSQSSRRAWAWAPTLGLAALATTVLLLGAATGAAARQGNGPRHGGHRSLKRVSLLASPNAEGGTRIRVSGRVTGERRARRVVIEELAGRRWRALLRPVVHRGRFNAVLVAPNLDEVLTVRALVRRRRHRALRSGVRRVVVHARHPTPAPRRIGVGVVGWGRDGHQELGAQFKDAFSAVPVSALEISGVQAVAATYFSSYALLEDGTVRAWGGNVFGQL